MSLFACGPDKSMEEATNKARIDHRLATKSPFPHTTLRPEHPVSFGPRKLKFSSLYTQFSGYNLDQLSQNQVQNPHLGSKDHLAAGLPSENFAVRRRNPITCRYYIKGFCKYRNNCKYLHDESLPRRFSPAIRNFSNDEDRDQFFSNGSLKKLEIEIVDILKSRRGPITTASLPLMYLERYGKSLQAEGYLTESQRHGKTGHSLTRLLSRISSVTLVERPHGQHFIVLAENASKSRRIYLTFPAHSLFTEADVACYFSKFGAVEDVRIPCKNQRMFGFVTFLDASTAQTILSEGNPFHYVCGDRIIVKPYMEKSKLHTKYHDGMETHVHHLQHVHGGFDIQSMARAYETSSILQYRKLMQIEAFRLAENKRQPFYNNNNSNSLRVVEDRLNSPLNQDFSHRFLNAENHKIRILENNNDDRQMDLPDGLFGAAIINTISNLI